jgi:ABC-type transport system involved in cytochrome bd biosynthesis fused ATPase/permease subunit
VLRNSTLWAEFSHTVLAAFVTGVMVVLGVSGWLLLRGRVVEAFRAVLADRPVLLLDEPSRHLDAVTADAVLQAVREGAGRTEQQHVQQRGGQQRGASG